MTLAEPTFPPLLDGRAVVKGDSPLELAIAGARQGKLGAGDTLWLQDTAQVDIAIVLEPDDPLAKSVEMLPLGVAAAGDCLAALTPPQVAVQYRWPGTILLNGAAVGSCKLVVPTDRKAQDTPSWMVLALTLRFAFDDTHEPGATPGITSLTEEGIEGLTTIDVIESYSRHFLSLLDTWTNEGFAEIAENWTTRLEEQDGTTDIHHPGAPINGKPLGLDENGNLLVSRSAGGNAIALALLDCVERGAA